jgi:hypothetical protein
MPLVATTNCKVAVPAWMGYWSSNLSVGLAGLVYWKVLGWVVVFLNPSPNTYKKPLLAPVCESKRPILVKDLAEKHISDPGLVIIVENNNVLGIGIETFLDWLGTRSTKLFRQRRTDYSPTLL